MLGLSIELVEFCQIPPAIRQGSSRAVFFDRWANTVPMLVGSIELTVGRSEFTMGGSRRISKFVACG